MEKLRELKMPDVGGKPSKSIETSNSVLFIGANGCGKTRLGIWIETLSPQSATVHRISAHKSLSMPDSTTPVSIELAENNLLWGHKDHKNNKIAFKYSQKPATALLNDFEKLMVYLFSDETESNAEFKTASKLASSKQKVKVPVTKLDQLKTVWQKVLPHRELIIGGLRIQTTVKGKRDKVYNSSEMSDGERVIFYLIGQCLAAPKNGIVVIDEPELHIHKSVQAPLWNEIEKLRKDCLFVYLTHDVDFSASQEGANKVWLKSYDGDSWEWEEVKEDANLSDELLLEILGSRKPIVFVEGNLGSLDVALYREILDKYLVVPRGGCGAVIQSVKAFRANTQLHHMQVFGIIDRDRRGDAEVTALELKDIFVLDVAEVENLFCVPEVLEVVSKTLARDAIADIEASKSLIFANLNKELEVQISMRVAGEIKYRLNCFDDNAKGSKGLNTALNGLVSSIDVTNLYQSTKKEFEDILSSKDYQNLLKVYNRKSLPNQISSVFGLSDGGLAEQVVRLAKTNAKTKLKRAVKPYFGGFSKKL